MAIVTTARDPVRATSAAKSTSWQHAMKTAIRDPIELCRTLKLPHEFEEPARRVAESFPVFVPRGFSAKMQPGDPHDPLLRQVLPLADELEEVDGFTPDPVGDSCATMSAGLIKKYHGRALLVTTGACAIHCRYCFRRHFPYDDVPRSPDDWQPAIDCIEADPSVEEILLSGGDPLTLVDSQLAELIDRLEAVPHLKRLRIHTRLPIVIPDRVTAALVKLLEQTRLTTIVVVHANHPAELDREVETAIAGLVDAGIVVLNQAVLLRGVNDCADTLTDLCNRLVDMRVVPYYLHQFDRVAAAAHFEVPIDQGIHIVEQLRARLPGYAVPRFVQEITGETSKRVLA